jgi:predicted ribosomally synthesized peptide with SipW-like signal peptide
MKNLVLTLMVLLIAIGLAAPMVGGTFASFSDIEISEGNYIDTADLDLKVNGKDDLEVEPFFDIPRGQICTTYTSFPFPIPLTNEGSVDGPLYLHIKNLIGPDSLSQNVDIDVWYDDSWVTKGSLYDLACQQIELGHNPADGIIKEVRMELHATEGAPGESLTFDIAFELFGACGYSDVETSQGNYFSIVGLTGTRGFWGQWNKHKTYSQAEINGWLNNIDAASFWLVDNKDSDCDIDTDDMDIILNKGVGPGSTDKSRFLAHYLAQRLDQESGRQLPATTHDVTGYDPGNYLCLANPLSASGAEIVAAIEGKYGTSPSNAQFVVMLNICSALNTLDI